MKCDIFRRNRQKEPETLQPLKIDGINETPMTMEPDKAELAAQALLEVMLDKQKRRRKKADVSEASDKAGKSDESGESGKPNTLQTSEYYHQLSDRIRQAYASSRQRTLRFLCYCEQQFRNQDIPLYGADSLNLMQAELYKRIDVVDREGGDIKARWQHCLAEVTLRQMEASARSDEAEEGKEE
ncbi:MAG: hypothetical protein SPK35_05725 [Prevotella sp.]|nr:hypothetical protein [Prevotella sp.]